MIWGAMAWRQLSDLVVVHGNLTAARYIDEILQPVVLPFLQNVNCNINNNNNNNNNVNINNNNNNNVNNNNNNNNNNIYLFIYLFNII